MQNKNQVVIYGRHAVGAALNNPQRKIVRVMCLKENAAELKGRLPDNKIVTVERRELEKLLPRDAVHQGMAAIAEMLPGISLEELCERARPNKSACVLLLDQVTDPQNIGAIIRSCAAFNVLALVVQDKNSPQESGALLKAAAGTFELVPVCRVTNLSRAIDKLKKKVFGRLGWTAMPPPTSAHCPRTRKLAVVMGSEGAGMRRLVEESCDMTVRLPINPQVESLNVSTAAAVVLYEINRK